ncbi:hypothetical protein [Arthrobacter sp. N199823]|nr:hypothetical protein [Arthrobacter sp. N199823]
MTSWAVVFNVPTPAASNGTDRVLRKLNQALNRVRAAKMAHPR